MWLQHNAVTVIPRGRHTLVFDENFRFHSQVLFEMPHFPIQIVYSWAFCTHIVNTNAPKQMHAAEFSSSCSYFGSVWKTVVADVPKNRLNASDINGVHYLSTTSSFVFHNIQHQKKEENNGTKWNDKIFSKSFKIGNGIKFAFNGTSREGEKEQNQYYCRFLWYPINEMKLKCSIRASEREI